MTSHNSTTPAEPLTSHSDEHAEEGTPSPSPTPVGTAGEDGSPAASPLHLPGGNSDPNSDSDCDSDSGHSGVSNISGLNWKPTAGPICWVQEQIGAGVDPREVLHALRPSLGSIPSHIDDITLWKLVIEMLSEPPRREKLRHVNTLCDVVRLIRGAGNVIVLTGAGVSVSCGIPDFRSRDGIYARLAVDFPDLPDPQAMFDIHYFRRDPRPFFKFAREIYPGQFRPSPCHRFIRMLERQGKLLRNYTQNIDTLEQQAGIQNVIQCHGSFATASCQRCRYRVQAEAIREAIFQQTIPACPRCGGTAGEGPADTDIGAGTAGEGPADTDTGAGNRQHREALLADTSSEASDAVDGAGGDATGDCSGATHTSHAAGQTSTSSASVSSSVPASSPPSSLPTPAGGPAAAAAMAHGVLVASAVDSKDGAAMAEAAAAAGASDVDGLDAALMHGTSSGEIAGHGGAGPHGGMHGGSQHSGMHHHGREAHHGSAKHQGDGKHVKHHGVKPPDASTHVANSAHHDGTHRTVKSPSSKNQLSEDNTSHSGDKQVRTPTVTEHPVRTGETSSRRPVSPEGRVASEGEDGASEDRAGAGDEDTGDSGFVTSTREGEDGAAARDARPPAIMKPDIVFFGEGLSDEFHRSMELDRERCDLLIVIGSSLKVRPVALIPSSVSPDVAQILINREPLPHLNCDVQLLGDCDVIVDHLCQLLGGPFSELLDREPAPDRLRELSELPPRAAPAPPPSPPRDPAHEHDTAALRHCWQPKVRESLAARLPEGTYLHQPPSRYIFPGAEVLVDPDDSDSDGDSVAAHHASDPEETPSADGDNLPSPPHVAGPAVTPPVIEMCPESPADQASSPLRTAGSAAPASGEAATEGAASGTAVNMQETGVSSAGVKRPLDEGSAGCEGGARKRAVLNGSGESPESTVYAAENAPDRPESIRQSL